MSHTRGQKNQDIQLHRWKRDAYIRYGSQLSPGDWRKELIKEYAFHDLTSVKLTESKTILMKFYGSFFYYDHGKRYSSPMSYEVEYVWKEYDSYDSGFHPSAKRTVASNKSQQVPDLQDFPLGREFTWKIIEPVFQHGLFIKEQFMTLLMASRSKKKRKREVGVYAAFQSNGAFEEKGVLKHILEFLKPE